MGPTRAFRSGLVACALAASACASEEADQSVAIGDVPVDLGSLRDDPVVDLPSLAADRPTTTVDVRPVPIDVPPTPIDVPPLVVDRPVPIDVPPVPVDLGPPAPTCTLPAPAARPPAAPPDGSGVIRALAAEHPDWLRDSCVPSGGSYRFLFESLRRLRATDPRWGLDRRTGALAGDIVTYFHGDGCPEGRREVYMIDMITRHCARAGIDEPAAPGWIDRSSEGGLWTLMGYDPASIPDAGTPPVDVPPTMTRPPLPDARPTLAAVASEHGDWLRNSCVDMGGNNDFLFEVVRRLRRGDPRWGLNWKRGRVGDMSQDVIAYYFGPGAPVEGSLETYIVDVIVGHCGATPSTGWNDVTGVGGADARWTLAGRTDL